MYLEFVPFAYMPCVHHRWNAQVFDSKFQFHIDSSCVHNLQCSLFEFNIRNLLCIGLMVQNLNINIVSTLQLTFCIVSFISHFECCSLGLSKKMYFVRQKQWWALQWVMIIERFSCWCFFFFFFYGSATANSLHKYNPQSYWTILYSGKTLRSYSINKQNANIKACGFW